MSTLIITHIAAVRANAITSEVIATSVFIDTVPLCAMSHAPLIRDVRF